MRGGSQEYLVRCADGNPVPFHIIYRVRELKCRKKVVALQSETIDNMQVLPKNTYNLFDAQQSCLRIISKGDYIIDRLRNIEWDFPDAKPSLLGNIHPYPAKFISEIPSTLIDCLWQGRGDFVLDPFCGSGSTLEAAQRHGIASIGVDLNPIACLISRVRTGRLGDNFLSVCNAIVGVCKSAPTGCDVPHLPHIDHWFMPEIQQSLSLLKGEIDKYADNQYYDALCFCFSSIIVKVSNQDSDTRYAFRDKKRSAADVYTYFIQSAKKLASAKQESPQAEVHVINKNTLKLTAADLPGSIGMVVTSPPYPNAYEYWLYHKYRMYWLGYNPIEVKNEEIGARAKYFRKSGYEGYDFAGQMSSLLENLYPLCADGAYLCFVIGRSKVHGRIYNNDEIISEAGENLGYHHVTTLQRNMNSKRKSFNLTHARINKEYIVVLQK